MYQLLTDSACDLSYDTLQAADVGFVPFHFEVDGQELNDDLGQSYDLEDFFAKIKSGVMPTTAQVNVGEYEAFFEPYLKAGTPVLYLGFSSGLSGSLSSALQARDLLLEKYPDATLRIVDTLAASAGEGRLVLDAIAQKQAGKSLDEVADYIEAEKNRLQSWFTVDNLDYLYHGGRVSRTAATLGTLLNIKPILDVDPEGKLRMVSKVRARKRALLTLGDKILAALPADPSQQILIATSGDWAAADEVKAHILSQAPDANVLTGPIGLTIASHTGFGCVAAFVIASEPHA
ncbi:DegV family protein [Lacticaseibacillus mingshuiensis]|uniref:DegV family protein n=1 Tax=Lacticaseibacillus mingshuiensis TaxID=2799574 RepID=A0ABW4CIH2_9LACO|nr:DegV family protein [Lacticaseibacillus mingshuiensis]